jgi:hypothetical protein
MATRTLKSHPYFLCEENFLEGTCIDLSVLHRPVYKQDLKEKENYKEVHLPRSLQ